MTYVITSNCQGCAFTDCVEVCPVDCFYDARETDQMLYINPDECIDCNACVPACPVEAIFADTEVPEAEQKWTEINADKTIGGDLEIISDRVDPLPGAEEKKAELGL